VTIKVLGECISNLKEGHKAALQDGERRANELQAKIDEQNEKLKSYSYQNQSMEMALDESKKVFE
jgi:hypothetical protein